MLRPLIGSLLALALCLGVVTAADTKDKPAAKDKAAKKTDKKEKKAKIVKVDAKKGTVTLEMKNKEGKTTKKTFKLAEEIRYLDSTGRVAAADVFVSGNDVLVIEEEGRITQMKKHDKTGKTGKKDKEPAKK